MSGHSKWSQIKRQKTSSDIKRGQVFTKISKMITLAVKQGGGIADPAQNFHLRLAVEKARQANMPNDNIKRAISRVKSSSSEFLLERYIFEGYGPSNVAVIIEVVTDNKQRSLQEIRHHFEKYNGHLSQSGSVTFMYDRIGQIIVKKDQKTEDDLFTLMLECQAIDFEKGSSDEYFVYTKVDNLSQAVSCLEKRDITIVDQELVYKPKNYIKISNKKDVQMILKFLSILEELDDVQKVYCNFDIAQELVS